MRVIEERHIHEKESFCTHCGSTLGYYPADIKTECLRDTIIYVKCPVCGKNVILYKFSTNDEYFYWVDNILKKWRDGV
ncbi:MAG: hypothetical protein J6T10_32065 [Methanobrevibacter sp.]|nr:hypothetical protein [Methanobrevibacter sp.]